MKICVQLIPSPSEIRHLLLLVRVKHEVTTHTLCLIVLHQFLGVCYSAIREFSSDNRKPEGVQTRKNWTRIDKLPEKKMSGRVQLPRDPELDATGKENGWMDS